MCLGSCFGYAPPLLAWVSGCVCACVRAALLPRHSWLGCAPWVCVLRLRFRLRPASRGWGVGVCVLVCSLCMYPATPGWGVRRGCVCLGSGFGCAPPLLAGVLPCVCVRVRAPLVPRHSWLGCALWVGALGLRLRLRPTIPGWGVGVCVCALRLYPATPGSGVLCGCVRLGPGFGCVPPLLARVFRCVCAPVGASLGPRHSWLGCTVRSCVCGLGFRLCPATPGWGAGVCVCVCVRAPLVPGHSWLECAVWVCVLRLRSRLRPATPGWGVGVCVFVWLLRLYPATPGWAVRRGCVCLKSGFGCAPLPLSGVLGCVCICVRAPSVPRHSWLGCAVWVCVLRLGFWLPLPLLAGVLGSACFCARSACVPPLLAGVCGVGVCAWARVSGAPRHSPLGCWGVRVFVCTLRWCPATPGWGPGVCVCALRLYPATPGWGVLCGRVCLGSGFGCVPPLLAGVLGCVCARVRTPLVPRHFWLGCWAVCALVCALRLYPATPGCGVWCGLCVRRLRCRLCPATLGWGVGVCVLVCSLRLYPATPGWGAVWVCVLGLGFPLCPATPGWGDRVCVCLRARSSCTPPLLAGLCGVGLCAWARVSAAPRHS